MQHDPSHDHTVLLVIHDIRTCLSIGEFLNRLHYNAVIARSARSALSALRAGLRPCIVFTELNLPDMDGPMFVHVVHSDPAFRAMKICVISDDATQKLPGVTCVLKRPIDFSAVQALVESFCVPEGGPTRARTGTDD